MKELEVKILDIDVNLIKSKLLEIGAYRKWEGMQKVWVFDVPTLYGRTCELLQLIENPNYKEYSVIIEKAQAIAHELKVCCPQLSEKTDSFFSIINGKIWDPVCLIKDFFADATIMDIIKKLGINKYKWVRIRSDDKHSTMTVKEIGNSNCNLQDVNEYEMEIANVESSIAILKEIGLFHRNYQEKYRISYSYKNSEIDIDFWPYINPYVEIEAENPSLIKEILEDIDINPDVHKVLSCNTAEIYSMSGLDIYEYKELRFPKEAYTIITAGSD